ncbi:MAG: FMN-binding glutamate synthase family protein [Gammaproteobacteria bacterium]|nr:FMN-binding glutamate synthase family protein [Gammaproteobacteria bacterium]
MSNVIDMATPWLSILSDVFLFFVGLIVLLLIVLFVRDITQTKDAVLRNYPVIGHFRYIFSSLGEFFRQYFFAMDREEMPFNRAEREWIHRASKDKGVNIAFGSTKNLSQVGTMIFENCPFPTLDEEATDIRPISIGEGYCKTPYTAKSLINISAMSFGALSRPAVQALSRGAKMAGCWYNTGEGGLSSFHLEGGADLVFQIGTAKYGVRKEDGSLSDQKLREIAAHDQVKMFEIKMSQGAKPGKGGILPADKVTEEIAKIRGIEVGKASISPNRHLDIKSVTDLLDMIQRIRSVTGKPTGFKSVIGGIQWVEELCIEINKRGISSAPDFITIDSGDGGTGAAPMTLMDHVGLPIKESLPAVVDILEKHQLRERIKVITSGKLINPVGVAWALCAGADFVNSARGFMFALGCIQSLKCNKNTCPTGITTHNSRLQRGLNPEDKSVKVANYVKQINYAVGIISHSCGVREPRGLGRQHVRIVQDNGLSVSMEQLYPSSR